MSTGNQDPAGAFGGLAGRKPDRSIASLDSTCRATLAWTDKVSGERLTIDMRGSRGFLRELEQLGFEIVCIDEAERTVPLSGGGTGTEAWSSAEMDGDRTRTGPFPFTPGGTFTAGGKGEARRCS